MTLNRLYLTLAMFVAVLTCIEVQPASAPDWMLQLWGALTGFYGLKSVLAWVGIILLVAALCTIAECFKRQPMARRRGWGVRRWM